MAKMQKRKIAFRVFCSLAIGYVIGYIGNDCREKAVDEGKLFGLRAMGIYGSIDNDEDTVYVSVPSSLRKYLIDNQLLSEELLLNGEDVDKAITNKTLSKLKTIRISAADTFDYSFLDYCTNLKKIEIVDSYFLTPEEVNKINSYNLDVEIIFNSNTIDYIACSDDVNIFGLNNLSISFDNPREEEVELLYKYESLLRDHFSDEEIDNLKSIDKWLDKIIDSIGILPEDDEYTKVLKISYYLSTHIIYDPNVNDNKYDEKSNSLITEYNKHPLSKLKEQYDLVGIDGNIYGICINYSSLFNALCTKCGVKSIRITGDRDLDGAHSWNKVIYNEDIHYNCNDEYSPIIYFKGEIVEYDVTDFTSNHAYTQIQSELKEACYSDNETKRGNDRYILTNVLEKNRSEPDDQFKDNTKKIERLYNEFVAGERVEYTADELKMIKKKLLESYAATGLILLLTTAGGFYLGKKLSYGIMDNPKEDNISDDEINKKTLEL